MGMALHVISEDFPMIAHNIKIFSLPYFFWEWDNWHFFVTDGTQIRGVLFQYIGVWYQNGNWHKKDVTLNNKKNA